MLITEPTLEPYDASKRDPTDDGNAGFGVAPEPKRVYWKYYSNFKKEYVVKFEEELAIAALLVDEREPIFLSSTVYKRDASDNSSYIKILANCSDVFMWACFDAEPISFNEIKSFYMHHITDPQWGGAVWCMKKRQLMPQKPVYAAIKAAGIWDIDNMGLQG